MNKGLEVIEAYWLFGFPPDRIKVLVHPQSVVHSLVKFIDGSVLSQMAVPDMKIPIAYALGYPDRLELDLPELELSLAGRELTFEEPDLKRFPCLNLAYRALESGYPYPIVLNAADEVAVDLFLKGRLRFTQIPELIEETLNRSDFPPPGSVEEVIEIDERAREVALRVAEWLKGKE